MPLSPSDYELPASRAAERCRAYQQLVANHYYVSYFLAGSTHLVCPWKNFTAVRRARFTAFTVIFSTRVFIILQYFYQRFAYECSTLDFTRRL